MHRPLKERVAALVFRGRRALKGRLKEGMRKVASEPEDPERTGSCGRTGSL